MYPYLLWYSSPAQTLTGQRTGPPPVSGRDIAITVWSPGGASATYPVRTNLFGRFTLNAANSGDPYFGVTASDTWRAQARDVASGAFSPVVTWDVLWYRVILRQ
jgi:hypothetical protein